MKKYTLLLILFAGMVNAQIINIPDANFKAKLLASDTNNTIANSPFGYIKIDFNNDGEIQVDEAQFVDALDLNNANISNLSGIEGFPNLESLKCANNQISSMDLSSLTQLKELFCGSNPLTALNLNGLTNLESISCYQLQLTSLDLTGLSQLKFLECGGNQLTALALSDCPNLETLRCGFNQITALDVSALTQLKYFSCPENQLTTLDLTGLSNIVELDCTLNHLSVLDLSDQSSLVVLYCRSMDELEAIFMKNGSINNSQVYFDGNPNLRFICVDPQEQAWLEMLAHVDYGYTNCVVNSYCSMVPGGNYNTINGIVSFDANNNGCDSEDLKPANIRINVTDGVNPSAIFTTDMGQYQTYVQTENFVLEPSLENPSYFLVSPASAVVSFADADNHQETRDFCITANGVHHDAEMVISSYIPARPGFDAVYKLVYKNKGNQTDDLWLNFTFNDNLLDFVSSSIPVNHTGGSVQVMIPAVRPFESGSVDITLNVNSPTETPAVNIGDILTFTSFIDIVTDENWTDNAFTLNQTVIGSFDPNDITCLEGNVVAASAIGNYLRYAINFENTGTFPAENIVVKTVIDPAQFDTNSLQLMYASHPVMARLTGNVVEFIFSNIDLSIGGHGHILLKIKTDNTLTTGSTVANRADIFFDYNFPVDTGVETTVFQLLSAVGFEADSSVVVAPNPAADSVSVTADSKIKSVALYDAQGRIIRTSLVDSSEAKISLDNAAAGIYFIKIITEKGSRVQKLVKE